MSRKVRNVSARRHAYAPIFAALADETRLALIAKLCDGRACSIAQLTEGTRLTRQAITKHLHALAEAGLVKSKRDGRERIWEMQTRRLADARRYLDQISTQWDEAIDRLRALVED